jgi:ribonuclease R
MSKRKKNKRKDKRNHYPQQQNNHNGSKKIYKGLVEVTRSGMAFVIVEGLPRDIMVKQKNLHTALNGDEVLVEVLKQGRHEGRMEGVVTDVTKRNKTEFTGTLQVNKGFAFLLPDKGLFMPDIYIPANSIGNAKDGDKAVVKVVAWGEKSRKPVGEIMEILDASDTNDLAMKEILVEAGFPLNVPAEVMEELSRIRENISEEEVAKRKDVREVLTMTIDPVDAKDFDDAISIRQLKSGWYEIGVHIADVSHYVLPGTALDQEADKRATSVYLPDRVLPMLPEKISNELCSLRPHEDKLTFSAIFQMNEKGEVKQHWIGRTVIHSNHRFTYEEVQEIIESGEGQYKQEVLLLNKIAQTLRAQRFANGAINFSSQEVRFKLDENGKPLGIVIKESKEAHQLIEELMLLANRTIATYVSKIQVNKHPVPFPYRVHDTPDPEKLKIFALFAGKFGYRFDLSTPDSIARSFNYMLQLVQGKPEQPVLETLGIRTMAKAAYTVDNIGHYGLGFQDYCHFTSPIRRYPDVLVHRVLAECLSNNIHPDKQMEQKCKHSSEMERKAMEAERAGNKYKQVEYMQQFIGDTFEGVISGVSHFGFWVETIDTKCEGLVSIHNLSKREDFTYNENEYSLVGQASGRKFSIGQKVAVRIVAANLAKRQLDYDLEEELTGSGYTGSKYYSKEKQKPAERFEQGKKKHKEKVRSPRPTSVPSVSLSEPTPTPAVDLVEAETHVTVPVTVPEEPAVVAEPTVPQKKQKKEVALPEAKAMPAKKEVKPVKKAVKKTKEVEAKPAKKAKEAEVKPVKKVKETDAKPAKKAAKKPEVEKAKPAQKAAKKTAVKPVKKAAEPKKAAVPKAKAKKPVAAKSTVKAPKETAPIKKAPAKKAAAKKAAPKKAAAKKAAAPVAKKAVAKKDITKKAPAKKAAAKKVASKVAVEKSKKAPAKKAATKAAAPKKAVKKAAPKKTDKKKRK